ncbi:adhesion G protein-coupled receptor L4-like [Anneissia japonica]|uniref:adhesion G protein-coupled receptor L4-like n=1 Tax=Anneissia japonica TaxID=1529436 RepID=UPI001425A6EF|nr:adhesion G protein-coupled receptor L4-like [Anneissia japonica]
MLTNVGVSISSFFLLITLVIICVFRELRNSDRFKIMRHLVIALICVNLFFLVLEVKVKNRSTITCSIFAGCLHYSLLAAFWWMLFMSSDLYMKVIHPFADHRRRFSNSRYVGWIGPIIVVGVTAGITRENYASNQCWLNTKSGAIWVFIFPVCLTVLVVAVQLLVIGYAAFKKHQLPNQSEDELQKLKRIRTLFGGILLLLPTVGLSWIFGVIIVFSDSKTFEQIFVILNSMQGLFIWLSQCVFSEEVRKALKKSFRNRVTQDKNIETVKRSKCNAGLITTEDI